VDLEKFLKNLDNEEVQNPTDGNGGSEQYLKSYYIRDDGEITFRIYPNLKDHNDNPYHQSFVHKGFLHPTAKDAQGNPRRWVYPCMGSDCPLCTYAKTFPEGSDNYYKYKAKTQFDYYIEFPNGQASKLTLSYAAHMQLKTAIIEAAKSGVNTIAVESGRFFAMTKKTSDKVLWGASVTDKEAPMTDKGKKRLKSLKPLSELNTEPKKEDLQNAVAMTKGEYVHKDQKIKEDDISTDNEKLDLDLPEDNMDSPEQSFEFDNIEVDLGENFDFDDDDNN
jgi:hypothetical protein